MTRQEALDIMITVQNRPENINQDILTFCGFMDNAEEILAHARRYGWVG
jgi:hypothetical protein